MSSADRDYWREDSSSSWSLAGLAPKWVLSGATVLAYLVQAASQNAGTGRAASETEMFILRHLALSLDGLVRGEVWQVATYALLHGDMRHLFWNMVALVTFLWVVEDLVSPAEAYRVYAVGAVAGAAGHALWVLAGLAPSNQPVVGASGAVTAIVVFAACRAARKVVHLFAVIPVPLWILGAAYVGLDLLQALLFAVDPAARDLSGVAVQAHLGGAAAGAILHWRPWSRARRAARRAPQARDEAAAPAPRPVSRTRAPDAEEARMDALLERIHSEGIGALTEEERSFLNRVSQRYRGRRG